MQHQHNRVVLEFKKMHEGVVIPSFAKEGDSGMDVRAFINAPVSLKPGEHKLIPTGLKSRVPEGFEIQVRPRSGLALRHGVTVLNSPGTVDSSYRGEIGVILINHGKETFEVEPQMRIAQLVVVRLPMTYVQEVDMLDSTDRGDGGFGHTGT